MFSNYLSTIEGIAIFPIISLIIFFTVFIGMVVWVIRIDKNYLRKMETLPLESDNELNKNLENHYERN